MKGVVKCLLAGAVAAQVDWETELTAIMEKAVANQNVPGVAAAVFDKDTFYFKKAVGSLTYGVPPPATPNEVPATQIDVCLPNVMSNQRITFGFD